MLPLYNNDKSKEPEGPEEHAPMMLPFYSNDKPKESEDPEEPAPKMLPFYYNDKPKESEDPEEPAPKTPAKKYDFELYIPKGFSGTMKLRFVDNLSNEQQKYIFMLNLEKSILDMKKIYGEPQKNMGPKCIDLGTVYMNGYEEEDMGPSVNDYQDVFNPPEPYSQIRKRLVREAVRKEMRRNFSRPCSVKISIICILNLFLCMIYYMLSYDKLSEQCSSK